MASSDISGWDPMSEDYNDKNFNRYNEGVGGSGRKTNIKLYVKNVPVRLDEEGFLNLFQEHGVVLYHKLMKPFPDSKVTVGYITMKDIVSAESAITALNNRVFGRIPLKVTPLFTDEEKRRRADLEKIQSDFMASVEASNITVQKGISSSKTSPLQQKQPKENRLTAAESSSSKFSENGVAPLQLGGSSAGIDMDRKEWHALASSSEKTFPKLSISIGRGLTRQVKEDSLTSIVLENTSVTIGRGRVNSDSTRPGSQSQIFSQAQQGPTVFQNSKLFGDMKQKSSPPDKKKHCVFCLKQGCTLCCAGCKMYYCSTDCQKNDWLRHQKYCSILSKHFSEDSTAKGDTSAKSKNYESDFSVLKSGSEDEQNKNRQRPQKSNRNRNNKSSAVKAQQKDRERPKPKAYGDQNIKDSERSQESGDESVASLTMPVGGLEEVYLSYFENPNKFWVTLRDQLEVFSEMCHEMNETLEDKRCKPKANIRAGETLAAKFQGEWSRVRVIKITPDEVTVFYLDYGNEEVLKHGDVYPLKQYSQIMPAQAMCCCLVNVRPKGSRSWNSDACATIKEFLGDPYDKELILKVTEKQGCTYAVDFKIGNEFLSDILIKKNCAERVGQPSALSTQDVKVKSAQKTAASSAPSSGSQLVGKCNTNATSELAEVSYQKPATSAGSKALLPTPLPKPGSKGLLPTPSAPGSNILPPVVKPRNAVLQTEILPSPSADFTRVSITFVKSCGEFYVRLQNQDRNFMSMMEYLNTEVISFPVLTSPSVGDLAAAQFSLDKLWYRVYVDSLLDAGKCRVFFLDYGNFEVVPLTTLRLLQSSTLSLPAQAIKCCFEGDAHNFSPDIQEEFKAFLENEEVNVRVLGKKKEAFVVRIFSCDGKDLSEIILGNEAIEQPETHAKAEVQPKVKHLKIDVRTLEVGSTVKVECVNMKSPQEFYVQPLSLQKEITTATFELTKDMNQSQKPVESVAVGDCVAARYNQASSSDEAWYRVQIQDIDVNKCTLFFVDYGFFEVQKISDLRQLSDNHVRMASGTVKCRLKQCKLSTLSQDEFFSRTAEGQIASIRIVEQNSTDLVVDVLDHEGKLITDKLLGSRQSPAGKPKSDKPLKGLSPSAKMHPAGFQNTVKKERSVQVEKLPQSDKPTPAMVMFASSCDKLYISLQEKQNDFLQLLIHLNESADSLRPLSQPGIGSLCAAQFSEDGTWYRAQIDAMCDSSKCIVHFIDFGNSEETNISSLKELYSEALSMPAQAILCCLEGHEGELTNRKERTTDETFMKKLNAELKDLEVWVTVLRHVKEIPVVRLIDVHGNSLAEKLSVKHNGSAETCTPLLSDIISETPPERTFQVVLCHFVTLHEFYCQRVNPQEIIELESMQQLLTKDVEKMGKPVTPCTPVMNGLYMCNFEGIWFRCVVLKIEDPKVTIQYIDYGNCEIRDVSDLRPLDVERLSMPVRLLKCKLFGVNPPNEGWWGSEKLLEYLQMLQTPEVNIRLEITGAEEDTLLVSMYVSCLDNQEVNMAEDLIDIGLVQPVFKDAVSSTATENASAEVRRENGAAFNTCGKDDGNHNDDDDDDDDDDDEEEQDLLRKMAELQMKLNEAKQKKKKGKVQS